jgi:hypothetical protein
MGNKQGFQSEGHTLGTGEATNNKKQRDQAQARARQQQAAASRSTQKKKSQTSTVNTTTNNKNITKPIKRTIATPHKTAQEKTAGRLAAARAAESRANAWDNKLKKSKSKKMKEKREANERFNQQQGTASASARAVHSEMAPVIQPTVNLNGFDPTQAVFRSSAQATNTMVTKQLNNTTSKLNETRNTNSQMNSSSSSSSSNSGISQFSSSILDHHTPVDQEKLARMMPLLQTSTIAQRNANKLSSTATTTTTTTTTTTEPLSRDMLKRLKDIFNDQQETPDLDFAFARLLSHSNSLELKKGMELLLKIIGNIMEHPNEVKYQKLKLSSKVVHTKLLPVHGTMDILAAAGFSLETDCIAYRANEDGSGEMLQQAAERIMLEVSKVS